MARYAFKNKIGDVLKQTGKICTDSTTEFGLKPLDAHELSGLHNEVVLTYHISVNWEEFGVFVQ